MSAPQFFSLFPFVCCDLSFLNPLLSLSTSRPPFPVYSPYRTRASAFARYSQLLLLAPLRLPPPFLLVQPNPASVSCQPGTAAQDNSRRRWSHS